MTFGAANNSRIPTLPQGVEIASFSNYLDAQKAVDYLSDKAFAVQNVTIVGEDVKMVERVTGRLTYSKVALAGMASGAWFGLFIGLLFMLFVNDGTVAMISAVAVGAGFGMLFSVISFALTGGKRDFTSATQLVAARYVVLCEAASSGAARELLRAGGYLRQTPPPSAPAVQLPADQRSAVGTDGDPAEQPSKPHPNFVDEHGRPRYGVRTEDLPSGAGATGAAPHGSTAEAPNTADTRGEL
ncbi:general stress protein [Rarobacter incanus]|uniref:General stress protein 17M-like domain-containing protein n=1 Tax=Rarobacter incanus TaxID=153494 RepID=A0A542SRA4_9MICO|nr:general stress protein [Rarobacter incanus]TQK77156.1 hypothetical protein FB389_1871 [Rarobacter incanus]